MRNLLLLSLLIMASGFASCYYGSLYARNPSGPPGGSGPAATERLSAREGRGGTFYISDDHPNETNGWQVLGVVLMVFSLLTVTAAALVWATDKFQAGSNDPPEVLKLR